MRYSVHFPSDLDLPREVRARAQKVLLDVARTLQRIPANPAWWGAMRTGFAEVNVGSWRFEYRIDPHKNCIQVVSAQQIATESV